MPRITIAILALFLLGWGMPSPLKAAGGNKTGTGFCTSCHPDLSGLCPSGFSLNTPGPTPANCLLCHNRGDGERLSRTALLAKIHTIHLSLPDDQRNCDGCHIYRKDGTFSLRDADRPLSIMKEDEYSLLKEIYLSWANSTFLDGLHGSAQVFCSSCHRGQMPTFDATVSNDECLRCHGPMADLIEKTMPPEFKDRNPHNSHLGEIDCTVCHKSHNRSSVYCLGCHKQFVMKIQGDGQQ